MPSLKQTLLLAAVALTAEALPATEAGLDFSAVQARNDVCSGGKCPSKDIRVGASGPALFDFVSNDKGEWHLRVDDCNQCMEPVKIDPGEGSVEFKSCERQQKMYYNVADKNWRAERTWTDAKVKKCYELGAGGSSCQIYFNKGEKAC